MRALRLEDRRVLRIRDIEAPEPGPGAVVIDVAVAGIGGSEYLGYDNPGLRRLPLTMGHGIVGVDPGGRRVAINPLRGCGACAFCRRGLAQLCEAWSLIGVQSDGGLAEQVAVPADSLVALPDALTWEQSAFVEPFANAVNAWDLSGAAAGTAIAVVGAGSLGLGLVACAAAAGCETVHVGDLSSERRAAALALGATEAGTAVPGAYDVVFDTVGTPETRRAAIAAARRGGKGVFLGFATPGLEIDFSALIRQQKQIIGAFVYSPAQFARAIDLAQRSQGHWVRNLSFAEVEPMLHTFLDGDFSTIKAALRPCR